MNTKKKMTVMRLLSCALGLLGFSACSNKYDDDIYMLMYGTPTAGFQIKGRVTSDTGEPLKGIQVVVRKAYDNSLEFSPDTIYTDDKGEFANKTLEIGWVNEQKAYFYDVDGEENGGTFKSDSIGLKSMTMKKIEEGDGAWNAGKYELSTGIKLSKEEKEE